MASAIDQLYALSIPEVQKVFLEVMQDIVDRAMLDEMVKAIEAGDEEALFRVSGFTPAVLAPIIDRIEQVYSDAAHTTVDEWPSRIRTPIGIVQPLFNMRSPRIEAELKDFSSTMITRITEEVRENVRTVLTEGQSRGDNPRKIALDIVGRINPSTKKREGGVIGLSANQVKWSSNARKYLEGLDETYFGLTLRDKRFDSVVKKAIETGRPLPQETISKLVTAYNKKALLYRGESIARTEAIQAINRGSDAAHQQGIDEGLFTSRQITKWWASSHDSRVRNTHTELSSRYTRKTPLKFEDHFVTVYGAKMKFPGDGSLGAPASELVMCRCKAQYHVDFLLPFIEKV